MHSFTFLVFLANQLSNATRESISSKLKTFTSEQVSLKAWARKSACSSRQTSVRNRRRLSNCFNLSRPWCFLSISVVIHRKIKKKFWENFLSYRSCRFRPFFAETQSKTYKTEENFSLFNRPFLTSPKIYIHTDR